MATKIIVHLLNILPNEFLIKLVQLCTDFFVNKKTYNLQKIFLLFRFLLDFYALILYTNNRKE